MSDLVRDEFAKTCFNSAHLWQALSADNFSPFFTSGTLSPEKRDFPGVPTQEAFDYSETVTLGRVPKKFRKRLLEYVSIVGDRILKKEEALAILRPERVTVEPVNSRGIECEFLFLDSRTCVRLVLNRFKNIPSLDNSVVATFVPKV